jgi:hypothetical protein
VLKTSESPFPNIESAHEYLGLLNTAVEESVADLQEEIQLASKQGAHRREQALRLAAFNLIKLQEHLTASSRLLNGLRSMRRLLLSEREGAAGAKTDTEAAGSTEL